MGDFIRGEYDRTKLERFTRPLRRLWSRMRAAGDPESRSGGPPDRVPMDGTRFALIVAVVALASLALSAIAVPPAAILAAVVRSANDRIGGGPPGRVDLPPIAQRSVVLARDGRVIATLTGEENRKIVSLGEVPPIAQQAVLAIEDAHFYEHRGVDTGGLLRALFANTRAGDVRQGGSTITQQLVKNTLVGAERSLDRKIKELQYARALERTLPKPRILELYLNEAYFGNGVYGIGTAAEFYFGKTAKKLTLAESALLAGLISAPERYDPLKNPTRSRDRRSIVLDRMRQLNNISEAHAKAAKAAPLGTKKHALSKPLEPYFVEYIKRQLFDDPRLGDTPKERERAVFQGGLRIETTLDLTLQEAGKKAVADVLNLPSDPSAALVSIEPSTGAVRTMVGGKDFDVNKFNLAFQGKRQPGSTFKPMALVAALDAGIPPTLTLDTPSPYELRLPGEKPYKVPNYSERGEGYMDLRRATELSVNSYYAQLTLRVGPQKIAEMATRLGMTSDIKAIPSVALGTQIVSPYEMASAYSTIANGGVHCKPYGIVRVSDGRGRVIFNVEPECERVIDGSVAAMAADILHGVIERGTGRRADIGRPAAGKTGTTDEYTDAWFGGFTPQFSTVVWMGFKDSNRKKLRGIHGYDKVCGGCLPAEIWRRYMKPAHEGLPVTPFPTPPPVPKVKVPAVVNLSQDEAKKALEDLGFGVKIGPVTSPLAAGTVSEQSPAPDTEVFAGSLVTLKVSDGKGIQEPPPSPNPSPSVEPSPSESPSPSPSPSESP